MLKGTYDELSAAFRKIGRFVLPRVLAKQSALSRRLKTHFGKKGFSGNEWR